MKLAVLDIDGTLLQTTRVDDACFVRAFRDVFGITRVDTDWSRYESCTDASVVPTILREGLRREPVATDVDRHRERFHELLAQSHAEDATAYGRTAGAQELLDTLRADPAWAVALATGGWEVTSRFKLTAGELDVERIPLATASDAPTREEIARIAGLRAAQEHSVEAFSEIVLVGDAVWDLRCARNLGTGFVGIAEGDGARRLEAAGATAVRPHFTPVGDFVELLATSPRPSV